MKLKDANFLLIIKSWGTEKNGIEIRHRQVAKVRRHQTIKKIIFGLCTTEVADGIQINPDEKIIWVHFFFNSNEITEPIAFLPRLGVAAEYAEQITWKRLVDPKQLLDMADTHLMKSNVESQPIRNVVDLFKASVVFF